MTEEENEQPEEKGKGNRTLIILLIAVAAVFAVLLSLSGSEDNEVSYNGFKFVNIEGLWRTEWLLGEQVYELDFRFNPKQVENIPVEGSTDERFQSSTVYLTIDPADERTAETASISIAAVEFARKLSQPFERDVVAACTRNETDACIFRPIINCDSTNSSVIYLKYAEEARIILEGNCATIQGKDEGIVMATDKALFKWLSIMD